jgi:hypothetical protein
MRGAACREAEALRRELPGCSDEGKGRLVVATPYYDDDHLCGDALVAEILSGLDDVIADDDDLHFLLKEKETPYE